MKKKYAHAHIALLFIIIPTIVLLCNGYRAAATKSSDTLQSDKSILEFGQQRGINVNVWVSVPDRYEFFNLDIRQEIKIDIAVNLTEPLESNYTIYLVMMFSLEGITGLPDGATPEFGFWGVPPVGVLIIKNMPANVSYSSFRVTGYLSGKSVLWRNITEVFFLNVTSTSPGIDVSLYELAQKSYRVVFILPKSSRFLRVYQYNNPDLPFEEVALNGENYVVVSKVIPSTPIVVLYEFETREALAITIILIVIIIVFLVPFGLRYRRARVNAWTKKLFHTFRVTVPRKVFSAYGRLRSEMLKRVSRVDSSKLLKIYILCALLMISLSFVAGPDPRPKVYVLASTPENAGSISSFLQGEGFFAVTVFEEMGELKLLSDLGVFSAVVVGDFVIPTPSLVKKYVYPALDVIPAIFVLENYASTDFYAEVNFRYDDKTSNVANLNALRPKLPEIKPRSNPLGLEISSGTFLGISASVGFLSLIIVFFGLAFLASKLIEVGKKPRITGFAEAAAYAFLYFAFTEAVYVVCTVLLALPLGLHTSSSRVTAIGFFGFGGGSRPRMLIGLTGFLFGSLLSLKGGPKLDKTGLTAIFIIVLVILVDPLTSGLIFYEFVLLFMTDLGPVFEASLAGWSYIRAFLYNIGAAFGGWSSLSYGISSGIMLYFTGAIPFCLYSKMQKSTGTVLLFFSAFCVAQGGIRIADMIVLKTVASSIPGIVSGFLFAGLFGAMSFAENGVRRRISKRGSI